MDLNVTNEQVSLLVACLALGLTIWQGRATIRHNKLSTKPMIEVNRRYYKRGLREVIIKNNGLGPAILTSLKVMLNDKVIVEAQNNDGCEQNDMTDFIKKIQLIKYPYSTMSPGVGRSILAGEEITLFTFEKESLDPAALKVLYELDSKLDLQIEYESIYKDKFIKLDQ